MHELPAVSLQIDKDFETTERTSCEHPLARDPSPAPSCIGGKAAAAAALPSSMRLSGERTAALTGAPASKR